MIYLTLGVPVAEVAGFLADLGITVPQDSPDPHIELFTGVRHFAQLCLKPYRNGGTPTWLLISDPSPSDQELSWYVATQLQHHFHRRVTLRTNGDRPH